MHVIMVATKTPTTWITHIETAMAFTKKKR